MRDRKNPESSDETEQNAPVCRECTHYYVTWDDSFPYGCRAMGFKSRRNPQLDVLRATNTHCVTFESRLNSRSA
jgi:hypothetical protein